MDGIFGEIIFDNGYGYSLKLTNDVLRCEVAPECMDINAHNTKIELHQRDKLLAEIKFIVLGRDHAEIPYHFKQIYQDSVFYAVVRTFTNHHVTVSSFYRGDDYFRLSLHVIVDSYVTTIECDISVDKSLIKPPKPPAKVKGFTQQEWDRLLFVNMDIARDMKDIDCVHSNTPGSIEALNKWVSRSQVWVLDKEKCSIYQADSVAGYKKGLLISF